MVNGKERDTDEEKMEQRFAHPPLESRRLRRSEVSVGLVHSVRLFGDCFDFIVSVAELIAARRQVLVADFINSNFKRRAC